MKRSVLIIIVLVFSLSFISSASAIDGPGIQFSNPEWFFPCYPGSISAVVFDVTFSAIPAGYTIRYGVKMVSPSMGNADIQEPDVLKVGLGSEQFFLIWIVPPDGFSQMTFDVLAPTGIVVTTASVYGECPSGKIQVNGGEIYGTTPLPAARVMGHVQYDTPLYTEANPDTVRSEILKAGQTWFVVGEKTGTDGKAWYQVFAGGLNMPFVPASAMALDGPLP